MNRLTVGGAVLDRIEETVDTGFTAQGFFPAFDPEALRPHMPWLAPRYHIAERGALLLPAHFAAPPGGHVRDAGGAFKLEWLAT